MNEIRVKWRKSNTQFYTKHARTFVIPFYYDSASSTVINYSSGSAKVRNKIRVSVPYGKKLRFLRFRFQFRNMGLRSLLFVTNLSLPITISLLPCKKNNLPKSSLSRGPKPSRYSRTSVSARSRSKFWNKMYPMGRCKEIPLSYRYSIISLVFRILIRWLLIPRNYSNRLLDPDPVILNYRSADSYLEPGNKYPYSCNLSKIQKYFLNSIFYQF